MRKKGEKVQADKAAMNTASDLEEKWAKDFDKFNALMAPNPLNDKQSKKLTDRFINRSLFFMVHHSHGYWYFPTAYHVKGETLRQTAEKALALNCGPNFKAQILGNAPFSFTTVTYSKNVREKAGADGEKMFLFKAFFQGGEPVLNDNILTDYAWLNRDEMFETVESRYLKKPLSDIIYDED